jgi:ethanolaminephosphotransferase
MDTNLVLLGPAFWDTGILTVTGLKNVDAVRDIIPNTPLNEAFMYFGAAGLLFNIASSYLNVIRARRAKKQSVFTPLAGLFPFVALTIQHILWMYYSKYADGQGILESSAFLPFVCAWGLQFAHNVGRMILAHVTHQPFPMFDVVNFVSIVGLLDALLPARLGR